MRVLRACVCLLCLLPPYGRWWVCHQKDLHLRIVPKTAAHAVHGTGLDRLVSTVTARGPPRPRTHFEIMSSAPPPVGRTHALPVCSSFSPSPRAPLHQPIHSPFPAQTTTTGWVTCTLKRRPSLSGRPRRRFQFPTLPTPPQSLPHVQASSPHHLRSPYRHDTQDGPRACPRQKEQEAWRRNGRRARTPTGELHVCVTRPSGRALASLNRCPAACPAARDVLLER